MKAIRYHEYGGPDVLRVEDAPRPEPGPRQILIQVHAAGVNPFDWKLRAGYMKQVMPLAFPVTPGADVSGVVAAVGEGVGVVKEGDEVFADVDQTRGGSYAEYTLADESWVSRKPTAADHIHAAGLPVAALTSWQALFDHGRLQSGQTVLIHGAAGGVGSLAVQLAKWKGARVIGTASPKNQSVLKNLGVDEPVDYEATRFEDVAQEVDVVLDTVGGETQQRSWSVLRKGGVLVSLVSPPSEQESAARGARGVMAFAQRNGAQLAEIARLVDAGVVTPLVDTVLPLSEAQRAHELSESGHARGKIVLRIL